MSSWLQSTTTINDFEAQLDSTIAWLETTRRAQQQLIQQLQCRGIGRGGEELDGVFHPSS